MEFDVTGYMTFNQKPWLQNIQPEGIFELHVASAKFIIFLIDSLTFYFVYLFFKTLMHAYNAF